MQPRFFIMNMTAFPFSKGKGGKNTLESTGNRRSGGKTSKGGSGIKQQESKQVFFQSQKSQLSWNPYGFPCLAGKPRGKPTGAPFLSQTTRIKCYYPWHYYCSLHLAWQGAGWYLPQKMSTREARGNNLLKAGIFFLAGGFRGYTGRFPRSTIRPL